MNTSPSMRRDPVTGAITFTSSPEAKLLLGLREDVQGLTKAVNALTDIIKQNLMEKEETPNG